MPTPTPTLQLGKNYRLKVGDGAGTEVFNLIGGEQKLMFSSSPDAIDASSKDDGNYKTELFGQQKVSITVSGKAKIPDVGLSRLDTLAKTGAAGNMKVVNLTGTATDVFVCSLSVGNRQVDFDDQQSVTYSYSLSLAAAPSVDSLFG
jgi:predicted secreted protein